MAAAQVTHQENAGHPAGHRVFVLFISNPIYIYPILFISNIIHFKTKMTGMP